MKKIGLAFLLTAGGVVNVNAGVVVSDSLGAGEWGMIQFDWVGGNIDINGFGRGYTSGETGIGLDDMYFSLFVDDGSSFYGFTGDYKTGSDDSYAPGWNDDGSVSVLDPYISNYSLAGGSYLLAVSHCCINFNFVRNIGHSSGAHQQTNDYQVTFSDGVTITAINGVPVSEPATAMLLGMGLAGLGLARRKKASRLS